MKTITNLLIPIGNFFFRWRDTAFTIIFLLAFYLVTLPVMKLGTFEFDIFITVAGFLVALSGQFVRGITIGYAYIKRGGLNKKIYADKLVISGMFNHSRNPLYVGNILIVFGSIMVINILWFYLIAAPLFYLIYIAITLAEEKFLREKFGPDYDEYTSRVNRFWPHRFSEWGKSIEGMTFTWKRLLKKEHNTTSVVFGSLTIYCLLKFHFRYGWEWLGSESLILWSLFAFLALFQIIVVVMKKTGKLEWDPDRP
ncbi:MAG: isoprenylcysteine carboxylmethyltransferase family protein [Spirochaetia bacterium]|nr:isoprenylcysteine carboxylmethyltransferase family protein [Spirochaetia bacterium]